MDEEASAIVEDTDDERQFDNFEEDLRKRQIKDNFLTADPSSEEDLNASSGFFFRIF